MFGRALRTIAIGMVIPIIGIIVAQWGLSRLTGLDAGTASLLQGQPSVDQAMTACLSGQVAAFDPLCREAENLGVLRQASFWSAAALILTIVVFLGLALIAGANRRLNAAFFPPLMPITTTIVAILLLVHGAILTFSAYVAEIMLFGGYSVLVLLVVGIGSLIGAVSLIGTLRRANQEDPATVLARRVTRAEQPALWAYVDDLADRLGAQKPKNIVVGLDPTFFATAAPILTPEDDDPLHGETLYFSVPLMRLFTQEELSAVIGHELGHFRGGDTSYSLRFQPVYRSLIDAIRALEGDDGKADYIAAIPGSLMLNLMLEAFARNERRISRDREFEADRAGIEVSNAGALAYALAKVAVYAPLWMKTRAENVARLNQGKISANLAVVFEESARYDVHHQHITDILAQVMTTRIAHPTDSHPPVAERYAAIGFDAHAQLTIEGLADQGGAAGALFQNLEPLERELTIIENKVMTENGHAEIPSDAPEEDKILNAGYVIAATMIGADGHVDPAEVQMAETIGARLFGGFDPVSFREQVARIGELPAFDSVIAILEGPLSKDDRRRVYSYLLEIAAADGVLAEGERELLNHAAIRWGIGRPLELRLPGRKETNGATPALPPQQPAGAAPEAAAQTPSPTETEKA